MKDKPLVSIVTPSYNQGRFIEDTILSVKNQDYPNIEHIIVDGGSTDNTLDILKKYEGTYNMRWISEPDEGQSDAINKGFRMAKGEIIGWLNSDDVYFTRDVISYVVEEFKRNPDVDVIYGNAAAINKDNVLLKIRYSIPKFSYKRLLRGDFIIQPSTFFRKAVVQKHILDTNLHLAMDYEYWLRLANDNIKFKHVNKVLSAMRVHTAMKTRSRKKEMQKETRKVQEKYGQKFKINFYMLRLLDYVLIYLLKIYGSKTIFELYSTKKEHFAFPIKFDFLLKTILTHFHYK